MESQTFYFILFPIVYLVDLREESWRTNEPTVPLLRTPRVNEGAACEPTPPGRLVVTSHETIYIGNYNCDLCFKFHMFYTTFDQHQCWPVC